MAETTTPRKNGAPSNVILIAAVVLSLSGLAVVNSINQKLDPKEAERRQQEAQQKQEEEMAKKAQEGAGGAGENTAGNDINVLVGYGEDAVVGKKDGDQELLFVWQWTPEVQGNPAKILNAVRAAETALPNAKIRLVNADATPGKEPGLYLGDKKIMSPADDGSFVAMPQAYGQLTERKMAPPIPPP